ncbi:MAG: hypothetical protein KDC49_02245 [Saprospiraceae bacterium]|nr:hypothetical protein [Saprospiraceae bacterium]
MTHIIEVEDFKNMNVFLGENHHENNFKKIFELNRKCIFALTFEKAVSLSGEMGEWLKPTVC